MSVRVPEQTITASRLRWAQNKARGDERAQGAPSTPRRAPRPKGLRKRLSPIQLWWAWLLFAPGGFWWLWWLLTGSGRRKRPKTHAQLTVPRGWRAAWLPRGLWLLPPGGFWWSRRLLAGSDPCTRPKSTRPGNTTSLHGRQTSPTHSVAAPRGLSTRQPGRFPPARAPGRKIHGIRVVAVARCDCGAWLRFCKRRGLNRPSELLWLRRRRLAHYYGAN